MGDLADARYLCLGTFRRSGVSVDTPVWAAPHGGKLYVFTAGASGKVKRLRASPRARVAPCDVRGRVLGAWREARARIVEERPTIEAAYGALHRKYGWQMWLTDAVSRMTGRYHRRAILEVEVLGPEAGTG